MANSIMQDEKVCFKTGTPYNLHKHHIFYGPYRKLSEEWGCWVWLRADWHNMSDHGVHFNKDFDRWLKMQCQTRFIELYGEEKFLEVFGRKWD